jgi:hypothetical protein
MIEKKINICDSEIKKEWYSPKLFQLDFNQTLTGASPANYEDTYNNNPTSGN